ncbi:MAG: MotA/TolQ/ExbB proton channel family protein [SAR324 cluster bacterium]|nr:MotA/TolQ/ExbB proton channel family protein [SAR324 cluster bacterium]
MGWIGGLFGPPAIENLVDENFPSWQDFSAQKMEEAELQRQGERLEIPPHKISISSPLQRNFLYFLMVAGTLGLGYSVPEWAPILIYGAILVAFVIALLTIFRDGIFLHMEGHRLAVDSEMINKHTHGPATDDEGRPTRGLLRAFGMKKKTIFRSKLLQIHYQNVLRTFEQGARRTWVYQDASISEIQTLLSQRGMKLVWTVVEVLPQLGLLGTLIGLTMMFMAFRTSVEAPEISIISGFGTALGTTILANLFVLVLRPLHMQNERSMNEILSTLQTLMAIFILPTQQYAMDRTFGRQTPASNTAATQPLPALMDPESETRISRTLENLTGTLKEYVDFHEKMDNGAIARETASIAADVQSALRSFQQSVSPEQLRKQQEAVAKLTDSVQNLSQKLSTVEQAAPRPSEQSERIEHDLTQLRVLTRDTLVLLEQIANRLPDRGASAKDLLSLRKSIHDQVFPEAEPERPTPRRQGDKEPRTERPGIASPRIRLTKERR